MERLPLETQTLYAELLDQLRIHEAERNIGSLSGTFVLKTVKGRDYYYFQHRVAGTEQQLYVGPRNDATERLVERYSTERQRGESDERRFARLAAQLRAGGAFTLETSTGRVLKALADGGVFRLGGVLVGTLAFGALGGALGVRWSAEALRTADIDLAATRVLDIAVPQAQADVPAILDSLEMGFLPVPKLNPKDPSTSFKVRGQSLRVDLLTPANRPGSSVVIHRLSAAAQPLKFIDYVIESQVQAAVIDSGATLVNVPDPARFAVHKLVVAVERVATEHTKTRKDLHQAAQVLELLLDERPGDVELALEAAADRGKAWTRRLDKGLRLLAKHNEGVSLGVRALMPGQSG